MTASFSLVLLVEFLSLFLSRSWEALVHGHLVVHHVLLLRELSLAIVSHHAHHSLWVVKHLRWHLPILILHLLHVHTHVVHLGWHTGHLIHLVGLHLVCSVHIEIFK